MLMKRSRPVSSSKQAIICEHNFTKNLQSPNSEKLHKPNSFLSDSPRIFKDFFFSPKESTAESIMSPSSILDTKSFFSSPLWVGKQIQNPKTFSNVKHSWEQPAIGLALIDSTSKSSKQRSKLVVFGAHLKFQIPNSPQIPIYPPPILPQSPMEFGIKTPKNSRLGNLFVNGFQQEEDYYYREKKRLLVEDMELSEDYTCVISHGPNPKTTHIFGNCIVASNTSKPSASSRFSYGIEGKAEREIASQGNRVSNGHENSSFLSFCHHCNKKIGQGKDIYMYRGEKAFCSPECRGQEMLFDGI
ncbi:hypothetical protein V2J09_022082 [Rumex salicifolius]